MLLEAAAGDDITDEYPFALGDGEMFEIDYRPMVEALTADPSPVGVISTKFHNTVTAMLAAGARRAREITSIGVVALSGGCLANRYLRRRLAELLRADGFEVLTHRRIPCNDGGVALGQAVAAAARLSRGAD